jgi:CDP-6-deoxy-D-xylo-4-hexulose-3-dehydrase
MKTRDKIKKGIFAAIAKLHAGEKGGGRFIPGVTRIPYGGRVYDEKELINLVDASLDFWLTAGRYAREFEERLSRFLDVRYCLLTNSGSSANLLAISALTSPLLGERRLRPGDEVITTACGFPTTLNPILQNRLTPVFVDVQLGTYNIDPGLLERAISRKTKAIFVPHTLGNPADIDGVLRVARRHDLWFIEDNCDSLGAKYRGKPTGAFGHLSTCSFYPPHHLTMGEGGAVMTSDPLLRRIVLSFRDWGRDCWCDTGRDDTCGKRFAQKFGGLPFGYDHKYVYSHIGYNLKITDLQAAIGCAQLVKLPRFIQARRENFAFLHSQLRGAAKHLALPRETRNAEASWFGFPILVSDSAPFTRAEMVGYLEKRGIATRMLFGGNLTKQPAYENIKCRIVGGLKNTDRVMNNLFWIGVYPGITREMRTYMGNAIREFMNAL